MSFVNLDLAAAGAADHAPRQDAAWLDAHWMPYTANRAFKAHPRMIVAASGAYFTDADGRKIFDGLSGLWCSGLGHGRREIAEAVGRQALKLDYAPAFQFGHPLSFELANRIKDLTPEGLDYVFFTGSGSEAADTSLKIARAYWRTKGLGQKTLLIGREKGYHGVNTAASRSAALAPTASSLARAWRPTTCRTRSRPWARFTRACRLPASSWPTSCWT